ncbi:hypothetical protein GCM10011352_33310 [Marinobacterium zhoushanense]|uniref:Ankyrin repeat protein n=1 Tax=Marinobacterium zhoushanense TaxID=1679163 RepID=A0ABQ1KSY6_9GAMM|nr:hypothetical protein [Marinobacterium zhoushanense]GGC04452.1 hypothetical protein GCM10011352_33310 [Marinobacterium zhoushanense]
MLKIFRDARTAKLVTALNSGDRDMLAKLAGKVDSEQLGTPLSEGLNAAELALQAGQPDALAWVLERTELAGGQGVDGRPYTLIALRHADQSLGLLNTLLQAGADANARFEGRSLLHWCFDSVKSEQLMLHLSRLVQHGAELSTGAELVTLALLRDDQATVHFLIHSGAPLPEQIDQIECSEAMRCYAKRCVEDKRIREMMLGHR